MIVCHGKRDPRANIYGKARTSRNKGTIKNTVPDKQGKLRGEDTPQSEDPEVMSPSITLGKGDVEVQEPKKSIEDETLEFRTPEKVEVGRLEP